MVPSPTSPAMLALLLVVVHPVIASSAAPLPTLHNVAPPDRDRLLNQRAQEPSGPYTPLVTPAPSAVPDDVALQNQGFRQETYYTCMTAASGREHCGWHTPLLKQPKQGSGVAAAPGPPTDTRVVVAVVAALAGLFAVGMM
ncbi:hypothetical protein CCM_09649 [Cordyceps militaris CM01]|uniref:Uncharacterized protein n=1 Tax=Cordyceps militaris (strain CM01) TaxID=983644 RepID=G3JV12_CORMM|nr:uncharacterized protein CCM_09649 [Cordyceps militaris CM01]EGX87688.1 hypothetical protein CCM_09649 [Cordyceps militaris CM01]